LSGSQVPDRRENEWMKILGNIILNYKLSWLRGKYILALSAIFIALFKPQAAFAIESEPMPLPIVENGNLLYINHQGKIIIDPKVKTEAKISKINYGKQYTLSFKFGSHLFFYDGLAAIRVNNKWGYINTSGKMVIPPQFDEGGRFRDGMATVGSGKYINRNGKLLNIKHHHVGDFSEGLAAVALPGIINHPSQSETAYVDRSGRVVIKTGKNSHYFGDYMYDFSDGLAIVEGQGYIDKTGKIVIKCDIKKYYCLPFREGLAAIFPRNSNNKGGFIDKKGVLVISRNVDRGSLFCEGLAGVVVNGKYGFINKKGDMLIEPKYEFSNLAHQYNYARNDANLNLYEVMPCFSDGLLLVRIDEKIGFMDKKGEIVISPTFHTASSFIGGAAFVMTTDNKWGWIDKTGAFIWKSK
jgi:WG containing repeat